jgi:hypothetical protein
MSILQTVFFNNNHEKKIHNWNDIHQFNDDIIPIAPYQF